MKIPEAGATLFVFCVYYPSSMKDEQVEKLNELLCDEIVKIKIKHDRPLFIIAGDMNQKDCSCFSKEFRDIVLVDTAPTRKDQTLDLCYTNVFVESNNVSIPLWSDNDIDSDHRVVLYNAAYIDSKHYYTTVIKRKITAKSEERFCSMIEEQDWSPMYQYESAEEKADFLHDVIERLKDLCFPMKRTRIRRDEDPWVTDHCRRLIRKRNWIFHNEGRNANWKLAKKEVRKNLREARVAYYDREVDKIRNASDKRSLAYTALKNINCPTRPKQWSITDLDHEKQEEEIVEELATYFNSVTEDHPGIDLSKIEKTYDRPIFELTAEMVENKIKTSKKPNSSVPGDIPPKLLNRLAPVVAPVVCQVFNAVACEMSWPSKWKLEYQTIIPKKPNPTEFAQLRNLSCTNFLSKVLESFVVDSLQSEIDLSELQYGGLKGCGTDNFLMEMWNNIHETVEEPGSAISLMSIDFSKAFNRLDHQACLEKLVKKNASNQTVAFVAAFLNERQMCVRSKNYTSKKRLVKGGSPQGTKLGNLLFCFAIDDITEFDTPEPCSEQDPATDQDSPERAFPPEYRPIFASTPTTRDFDDSFNPNPYGFRKKKNVMNDTAPFLPLPQTEYASNNTWEIGYIDDLNVGEALKVNDGIAHITVSKEVREIRAAGCEEMYCTIEKNGGKVGLKINPDKTQLLCITPNNSIQVKSFISLNERKVESKSSLKILGFMFNESPTPLAHVEYIVGKYYNTAWSIFHLKKSGMSERVLVDVFKSMVRPVLEYGANVICSMLTEEENEILEQCQRKALRIIFNQNMSYSEMLIRANLPTLKMRRRTQFEKFCIKMSASERFKRKWLPEREDEETINLRKPKKYIEFGARTNRLFNSPLFAMRRYLNEIQP